MWENMNTETEEEVEPLSEFSDVCAPSEEICMFVGYEGFKVDMTLYNLFGMFGAYLCNDTWNVENQYSGFLTLCNLIAPGILDSAISRKKFKDCGFDLKIFMIQSVSDFFNYIVLRNPAIERKIKGWIGMEEEFEDIDLHDGYIIIKESVPFPFARVLDLTYDPNYTLAMSSVLFLMMFKVLTNNNHAGWMKNRWRTFTSTLFLAIKNEQKLDENVLPDVAASVSLCRILTAFPDIRKSLFEVIYSLSQQPGEFQKTARSIVLLLKGTELKYITMIFNFVINRHPELMSHTLIKPEVNTLFRALSNIRSKTGISDIECQYMKILLQCKQTRPLNRQNFPNLIYLAKRIGMRVHESLKNYITAHDSNSKSVVVAQLDMLAHRAYNRENGLSAGRQEYVNAVNRARTEAAPLRKLAGSLADTNFMD